ncbi:hypothetical protein CPB84DRAFT_283235 [Gymnopilus junonius]|uniref:Uncharacterized protein n=1 Tax=Gymnopilus junonius TaxID=109634 RepID=A0A9P5NF50_GYMJU|nr:hypothetical protein CPB84DRAFT_283235 [Gymnopilus junonius]
MNTWGLQNQEPDREYLPPYGGQCQDNNRADSEYTASDRNCRFIVSSPEVSEPVDNAHHGPGEASSPTNHSNGRTSDQEEGSLSTNTNDGGITLNYPRTSSMQTVFPELQNEMNGQEQMPLVTPSSSSSSPPSIAHVVSSTLGSENNDASKKKKRKSLLKMPFKFIKRKNGKNRGRIRETGSWTSGSS